MSDDVFTKDWNMSIISFSVIAFNINAAEKINVPVCLNVTYKIIRIILCCNNIWYLCIFYDCKNN